MPSAAHTSFRSSRNGSSESIMSTMSIRPTKFLFMHAPTSVPNFSSNAFMAFPNISAMRGFVLEQTIVQNPTAAVVDSMRVAIGKKSEHCTLKVFDHDDTRFSSFDRKSPPMTRGIENSCFAYPIASPPFRRLRTELWSESSVSFRHANCAMDFTPRR